MSPRSPLPQRHGLDAAWGRTPGRDQAAVEGWSTMGQWLRAKYPDHVDVTGMLGQQRFVYDDLGAVRDDDPFRQHVFVWFHRDLREERPVPGVIHVLHRDERLVVVDKPPFLSTIPRGQHVRESVVVRLRAELGLPELSPMHRLDRITSGVLVLATERRWRGAYQTLFQDRAVRKTYRALAGWRDDLELPVTVRNHLRKERGQWQAEVVPDARVNAETLIEVEEQLGDHAVYRLSPRTGRTHQLRLHLHGLGIPIVNDPLYPEVREVSVDDFAKPLQLLAYELAFTDPIDGSECVFRSIRRLPLAAEN